MARIIEISILLSFNRINKVFIFQNLQFTIPWTKGDGNFLRCFQFLFLCKLLLHKFEGETSSYFAFVLCIWQWNILLINIRKCPYKMPPSTLYHNIANIRDRVWSIKTKYEYIFIFRHISDTIRKHWGMNENVFIE